MKYYHDAKNYALNIFKASFKYVKWVFFLFSAVALVDCVTLSYNTMDLFFPLIDMAPGAISVIMTVSFMIATLGILLAYFNYKPKYASFFLYNSAVFISIVLVCSIIYTALFSGNKYIKKCIIKIHTFMLDNPNSIETAWFQDKLNFNKFDNDEKLSYILNYLNARANRASYVMISFILLWAITAFVFISQLLMANSKPLEVAVDAPTPAEKLHFDNV